MLKTFHNCLISSIAASLNCNSTSSRPHAVDVTPNDARGYILPFCYEGISKVLNIQKMSSVHPSTQYIPYVIDWIQDWAICWPWQVVDVVLLQVTLCYSSGVRASIVLLKGDASLDERDGLSC